jgi:hypothetical protein
MNVLLFCCCHEPNHRTETTQRLLLIIPTFAANLHIPIQPRRHPQDPSPSNQFKIYSIIPVFRRRPTWKKLLHCITAFRRSPCVRPTYSCAMRCNTYAPLPQHLSLDPHKWKEKRHVREQISGLCFSSFSFRRSLTCIVAERTQMDTNLRSAY